MRLPRLDQESSIRSDTGCSPTAPPRARVAAPALARMGAGSTLAVSAPGQVLTAPAGAGQAPEAGPAVPASPRPSVRGLTTQARAVAQETPREQACLQNGFVAWKDAGHSTYVMGCPTTSFAESPRQATGGNLMTRTSKTTRCGGSGTAFHDPFSQKVPIEKESVATYGGFFRRSGIGLSVEQRTTHAERFFVMPSPGKTAHFCGDDAGPTCASHAKETDPR